MMHGKISKKIMPLNTKTHRNINDLQRVPESDLFKAINK
jgi:hypothetical protein